MNLYRFIFVLTLSLTSVLSAMHQSANQPITYRQATINDLEQLLALCQRIEADYAQGSDDAINRLVLFPQEVRREIIAAQLTGGKFFVALNAQDQIVAFIKLYLIHQEQLDDILHQELKLGIGEPLHQGLFMLSDADLHTYQHLTAEELNIDQQEALAAICRDMPQDCLYLYIGGAYTLPEYRGMYINSALISNSFATIRQTIAKHLAYCNVIALVYGQVDANSYQQRFIRPFAALVKSLGSGAQEIPMLTVAYRAYMPVLTITPQGLAPLPLTPELEQKTRGQGCLLAARV